MSDYDDLKVLVESRTPIIVIESREERAIIKAFHKLVGSVHKALYSWSITSSRRNSMTTPTWYSTTSSRPAIPASTYCPISIPN